MIMRGGLREWRTADVVLELLLCLLVGRHGVTLLAVVRRDRCSCVRGSQWVGDIFF